MITYFITGGAGFIASNLIDRLLEEGNRIVAIDNFDPFYDRIIKQNNIKKAKSSSLFHFVEGDIRNKERLAAVFNQYPIDAVIHLAAKAGVRPSIAAPEAYYEVNVQGTLNLLEVMKTFQVKKMIFTSSSSVYGNNEKIPFSENDNVDFPISPYAATKKSGELLTHIYHHLYGFDIINLRLFTVYGPRQRPDLAIHKFFKRLYADIPIDIYGDGTSSRDYTYVEDIVQGLCGAWQYLHVHSNVYETLNLGNSEPIQLSELVGLIEEVCGKKLKINHLPAQQGDVNRTYAAIQKAKDLIDYRPQTTMKQGLIKFKNWYEENYCQSGKSNVLFSQT